MRHRVIAAFGLLLLSACGNGGPRHAGSRFLYIWAGDKDEKDSDFLEVVAVRESSKTYGQVLTTVPVGMSGTLPHHMEYWLPDSTRLLFINGHHHEQIFLFDTRDAEHPKLVKRVAAPPPYRYPHDMIRMANGHLMVGYLRSEGPSPAPGDTTMPGNHGGVAELDSEGTVLRTASAADSTVRVPIRPYSFVFLPTIDRMLMTSAPMMEDTSADVIQIWRTSDLKLLKTIQVPTAHGADGAVHPKGHRLPFEPRLMPDGSVLFSAYGCGLYRVTGLDRDVKIENVYTMDVPEASLWACGIPVYTGHFWVMTVGHASLLVTLDVSDPAHPKEVARLAADSTFKPHWLAKDPKSDRLIVGAENGGENRMLMARLDTLTGKLSWDQRLRSPNGELGISFRRTDWPHGPTGEAFGHAALFRP